MTEWGTTGIEADLYGAEVGRTEEVQLIGPHLRISGTIDLGRFARLTDKVNHTRGYVRLHDARLLRRNGDPTSLVLPVLMVDQDEITFIGQSEHVLAEAPTDLSPDEIVSGDRPEIEKSARRFVILTPGHAITGNIHVHEEMTIENFVDASDPRFVVMTSVSARSLADRRVISHFEFLLVNRTQMTAIAETGVRTVVSEEVVEAQAG
jgi:hypothetical protein